MRLTPEIIRETGRQVMEFARAGMTVEERLEGLKPEDIFARFKAEEILLRFKPEERLAGLKPEEIEAYLKKMKRHQRVGSETVMIVQIIISAAQSVNAL